uniref:Uncharacterized protein n=1 Tax=Panagrolaimus sp. JU765 TaxID=591449 RepID=A0AC34Q9S1_9BILA
MGKKVRSFSSTPAKKPKKFATNTPIVNAKPVETKKNQNLNSRKPVGLFDSDDDYEDDEISSLDSGNEDVNKKKLKSMRKKIEDGDDSDEDDEDFKPVYEEVSEDDDWQNDDLDDEAFDLIKDQEDFDKTTDEHVILSDSEAGNMKIPKAKNDDSDEDEDFKPVYEELSEDDDWQNDDLDEEAFDLIKDQEEHEEKEKLAKLGDEEDDDGEDEDLEAEDNSDLDEEMEFGDDESEEEEHAKLDEKLAKLGDEEDDDGEDEDLEAEDNSELDEEMEFGDDESEEEEHAKLDGEEDLEDMDEDALEKHEAELKKLMADDPKFAEFLKAEETDLLDFGEKLDEEEEEEQRIPITEEMIKSACKVFEDKKATRVEIRKCVHFAVKAFVACVKSVSPNAPDSPYIVTSEKDFDRIVKMSFTYLSSAFLALLEPIEVKDEVLIDGVDMGYKLRQHEHDPMPTFKHWKQCHGVIKQFCHCLNIFLMEIPSDNILKACLRAVMDNANLFIQF